MTHRSAATLLLLSVGGFVALAVISTAGGLTRLDQYAVDHWMPQVVPQGAPGLWSFAHFHRPNGSPLEFAADIWVYPASALVSAAILGVCCVLLARRGKQRLALLWAGAWVFANLVEVLGKHLLDRPSVFTTVGGVRVSMPAFDTSFPSGHAARAVILAGVIACVWPRVATAVYVWAAVAIPALVVNGDHLPSDVAGGALLGLTMIAAVNLLDEHARVSRAG